MSIPIGRRYEVEGPEEGYGLCNIIVSFVVVVVECLFPTFYLILCSVPVYIRSIRVELPSRSLFKPFLISYPLSISILQYFLS